MGKTILVTGGTGFIGGYFCRRAVAEGHRVYVLTRDIERARHKLPETAQLFDSLADLPLDSPVQVVLNLAGESLFSGRWTKRRKALIRDSRIGTTKALWDYFSQGTPPELLISGSAIGYYGPSSERKLDESGPYRDSFSHQLCADWEEQAKAFCNLGTRVCLSRTGIVLARDGGALGKMLPAFKLGLGGQLGRGNQWMSWIHINDMVNLLFHCMARADLNGAVNATAPNPVRNRQFTKALGRALHRPTFFCMPAFAAKLVFGEMAKELLLSGQHVVPRKARETGFKFQFPELAGALADLV